MSAGVLDFFQTQCQSGPHTSKRFGVCDAPNGGRAYVVVDEPKSDWVARVANELALPVMLIAIDGCVITAGQMQGHQRCDALLFTEQSLHLVELKDRKRATWVNDGIAQLASTVQMMKASHDLKKYTKLRAHICNKRKPYIQESHRDKCAKFHSDHGFQLYVMAEIKIEA